MLGALISGGMGLGGGLISNYFQHEAQQANMDAQKAFAKHGIRWRVEDAQRAGIHPLYALGANTHQFSPISMDDQLGPAVAQAGQDIGNMVARRTEVKLGQRAAALGLEDQAVDIMLKKRQARDMDLEYAGKVQGQADSYINPHILPGVNSFYQREQIGPGFEMLLPRGEGEGPMEVIQSMSMVNFNAWVNYNSAVYGKGWKEQFWNWYAAGVPPGQHKKGDRR